MIAFLTSVDWSALISQVKSRVSSGSLFSSASPFSASAANNSSSVGPDTSSDSFVSVISGALPYTGLFTSSVLGTK